MSKYTEDKEYRYIMYAIFIQQDIFTNPMKFRNNATDYGIYHYALTKDVTKDYIAERVLYEIHAYKNYERSELENCLSSCGFELMASSAFNGNGDFEPDEDEKDKLIEVLEENEYVFKEAQLIAKIISTMEDLNLNGNVYRIAKAGKIMHMANEKPILTSCKLSVLLNSIDDPELFAAFQSIKSIVGVKLMVKTNTEMILARMFGYDDINKVPDKVKKSTLFQQYSKRWNYEQLFLRLEEYGVKMVPGNRGRVISTNKEVTIQQMKDFGKGIKFKLAEKAAKLK